MRNDQQRTNDTLREKVEVLTGERANGVKRAIRASDLDALRRFSLTAKHAAGSTPTAAEFNKIVDDVRAIADIISAIK